MSRHAIFLRGMNVGGHRLSNAELCQCFTELGFEGVASFRASGNVALSVTDGETEAQLLARIERGLAAALGYAVPAYLRSAAEVRAIEAARPFATDLIERSAGKLQVLLLAGAPSPSLRRRVLALAAEHEALRFAGRELFWLPAGGLLESGLDLKALERLLGPVTIRTKATIEQFARRHFAAE